MVLWCIWKSKNNKFWENYEKYVKKYIQMALNLQTMKFMCALEIILTGKQLTNVCQMQC